MDLQQVNHKCVYEDSEFKRGFQASCVYINQEGYPGLHVSIQIGMFMGISDLK